MYNERKREIIICFQFQWSYNKDYLYFNIYVYKLPLCLVTISAIKKRYVLRSVPRRGQNNVIIILVVVLRVLLA